MDQMEKDNGEFLSQHFDALITTDAGSINAHCKNLEELSLDLNRLGETEASTIVNLLPTLRFLAPRFCHIERNSLLTMMRGCKKLVEFWAELCVGLEVIDKEIKMLDKFKREHCINRFDKDASIPEIDAVAALYHYWKNYMNRYRNAL